MKFWEALKLIDKTTNLSIDNFLIRYADNRNVINDRHNIILNLAGGHLNQDDYIFELKLTREEKIKNEIVKVIEETPCISEDKPLHWMIDRLMESGNLKLSSEEIQE